MMGKVFLTMNKIDPKWIKQTQVDIISTHFEKPKMGQNGSKNK